MSNQQNRGPYPPTWQNAQASLDPPSHRSRAVGIPPGQWYRDQVLYTTPIFPADPNIARVTKTLSRSVINQPVNVEVPVAFQVSPPTVIYARAGTARVTGDEATLPSGVGDPRDTFRVQFIDANGDRWDTEAVLGSNILGSAERPCNIGGGGWLYDRNSQLRALITPLYPNLEICVTLYAIEVRGPQNYTPLG